MLAVRLLSLPRQRLVDQYPPPQVAQLRHRYSAARAMPSFRAHPDDWPAAPPVPTPPWIRL